MKYFSGIFSIIIFLFILISCNQKNPYSYAFYHWKSKADYTSTIAKVLESTEIEDVYMHFFDVALKKRGDYSDDLEPLPTYKIKNIDPQFREKNIIPTIFITNETLKSKRVEVSNLAKNIGFLISKIQQKHQLKISKKIMVDCDWTAKTRYVFFELVDSLNKQWDVEVTLRLHQIKDKELMGVPPVKKASLMLYNVGDLSNWEENSILNSRIVDQYIKTYTQYPIPLSLALPLYSQTVIKMNNGRIKLINQSVRDEVSDKDYFSKTGDHTFVLKKDTLFHGFFLLAGTKLKIEEMDRDLILDCYSRVKNSQLDINQIIFYHLEDKTLEKIQIENWMDQL
jgi:hypothetical protein